MKRKKHILPGTTLAEVLVLMIVAGIVFLAVTDGTAAFRRFIAGAGGRIIEHGAFYDSCERLDHLVAVADSIRTGERGRLNLFREGALSATLECKDSLLLVRMKETEDTLFRRVSALDTVGDRHAEHLIDSLHIELFSPRDSLLRLTFGRRKLPPLALDKLIAEEERYRYE